MKHVLYLLLVACMLIGCTSEQAHEEQHEGIIAHVEHSQNDQSYMLVITGVTANDLMNKSVEELTELARQHDSAFYRFTQANTQELHIGTHVIVHWNGTQQESDPPQRTAEQITVVMP